MSKEKEETLDQLIGKIEKYCERLRNSKEYQQYKKIVAEKKANGEVWTPDDDEN